MNETMPENKPEEESDTGEHEASESVLEEEIEHIEELPVTVHTDNELLTAEVASIRSQILDLNAHVNELTAQMGTKAEAEHTHPLPKHVETISQHLAEIEAEETKPSKKESIFFRRLGG